MSRSSRAQALQERQRAQVRAMRLELERRKAAARARLEKRRMDAPRARRHRRRGWVVLALLLLLLLLLHQCEDVVDASAPASTGAEAVAASVEPVSAELGPALPGGRVASTARPSMPLPSPDALPWLSSFELQVAARSPRLAACFEGAQRPGALRWTTRVEVSRGTVSDHRLEPVLEADALQASQRACVLSVLASPPYALADPDRRSVPPRVSLVIEF